jgi:NaMN:DMB phosphoribosyltransferase
VGASVGTAVAGACVAAGATVAAGACVVAGAAVVAGAPQEESNMAVKTSRLAKDHNMDFLFISLSPYNNLSMDSICGSGILF